MLDPRPHSTTCPRGRLLDRILAPGGISTRAQPIFCIQGPTPCFWGVEALSRGPEGTNAASADILFEYVRLKRAERMVDRVCLRSALDRLTEIGTSVEAVAINVHASTLGTTDDFVDFLHRELEERGMARHALILEVVEQTAVWDTASFRQRVEELTRSGIRIAIDDFGVAHSNFRILLDCEPAFVKIDRILVQGCHKDSRRRAILESIASICHEIDAQPIAEGIETEDELLEVRRAGITLGQGYYLARPMTPRGLRDWLRSSASKRRPGLSPCFVSPTLPRAGKEVCVV